MKKKSLLPTVLGVGLLCGILLSVCCLPEFAHLSRYRGMQAAANGLAIGCAAGLGCWAINRSRSPQKRREMERADRDERSRMILGPGGLYLMDDHTGGLCGCRTGTDRSGVHARDDCSGPAVFDPCSSLFGGRLCAESEILSALPRRKDLNHE